VAESKPRALVGVGVYSISEAAHLTCVPVPRIQRWIRGYKYDHAGEQRSSPAVWRRDLDIIEGQLALSFLDMMEVRFIQSFRQHHVSWPAIREAAMRAAELFEDGHPFTNGRFRTDGKTIFRQIEEQKEIKLFDMNRRQWVFNDIVAPSLFADVDLSDDQVVRWYPEFPRKQIVIDPRICFGRPIVAECGIPTDTLAAAKKAEGSEEAAAKVFGVKARHIRAAWSFEHRKAA
jgi:uncharacterized protein (DUF433 family)